MNTTSRHESTGAPGKIHCSKVTYEQLKNRRASANYDIVERGLVEMKGKGKQLTYWLTGSDTNELVNKEALEKLDVEVKELLAKTDFENTPAKNPSEAKTSKVEDVVDQLKKKAWEVYIEDEVARRVQEATETVKNAETEHPEDTGLVREVAAAETVKCLFQHHGPSTSTDDQERPLEKAPKKWGPLRSRSGKRLRKILWFV